MRAEQAGNGACRPVAPCARPEPAGCAQGQMSVQDAEAAAHGVIDLGLLSSQRLRALEAAAAATAAALAAMGDDDIIVHEDDDDDGDEDAYPPGEGSEERSQSSHEGDGEEAGSERSPSAASSAAPTPLSAAGSQRSRGEASSGVAAVATPTPARQVPARACKRSRSEPLGSAAAASTPARPASSCSCKRGRVMRQCGPADGASALLCHHVICIEGVCACLAQAAVASHSSVRGRQRLLGCTVWSHAVRSTPDESNLLSCHFRKKPHMRMPCRCVTQHAPCAPAAPADASASAGRPLIRQLARDFGDAASAGSGDTDGATSDDQPAARAGRQRRAAARRAARPARSVAAGGASRVRAPRRRARGRRAACGLGSYYRIRRGQKLC